MRLTLPESWQIATSTSNGRMHESRKMCCQAQFTLTVIRRMICAYKIQWDSHLRKKLPIRERNNRDILRSVTMKKIPLGAIYFIFLFFLFVKGIIIIYIIFYTKSLWFSSPTQFRSQFIILNKWTKERQSFSR